MTTFNIEHLHSATRAEWLTELAKQYTEHYLKTGTVATTIDLSLADHAYFTALMDELDGDIPLKVRAVRQLPANLARIRT